MKFKLQQAVPYPESRKWEIHIQHYLSAGPEVWLKREIPSNVTTNPRFAWQQALLLRQALQAAQWPPDKPIYVLETGAGLGVFALNFIAAFQDLCQTAGQTYSQQLVYWITDLAQDSLRYAAQHPLFKHYQTQGQVHFACMDILNPTEMFDPSGQRLELPASFFFILSHYQHSVLPVTILTHQGGQFYEKYLALDYWLTGSPTQGPTATEKKAILSQVTTNLMRFDFAKSDNPLLQSLHQAIQQVSQEWAQPEFAATWDVEQDLKESLTAALLAAWQSDQVESEDRQQQRQQLLENAILAPIFAFDVWLLEHLESHSRFHIVDIDTRFDDPVAKALLHEIGSQYPLATVIYPLGSLQALALLKPLLEPHGLMVITDKGYHSPSCMCGVYEEEESLHGNTLSHSVNFPFLEAYWITQGGGALRTTDETYPVHTLLLTSQAAVPPHLGQTFLDLFVNENHNLDGHADLEAGQLFMQNERLEQAVRYYLRALKYRPTDATILYLLVVCLLNRGHFSRALSFLEQPHDDYFDVYNFAVLKAEAYRSLERYQAAIPCYEESLCRYGANAAVYYNLGLCWEVLNQPQKAQAAFAAAARCDPDDPDIQEQLRQSERA